MPRPYKPKNLVFAFIFKIPVDVDDSETEELLNNSSIPPNQSNDGFGKKSWLAKHWRGFDNRYLKPLLCTHFNASPEQSVPLIGDDANGASGSPASGIEAAIPKESSGIPMENMSLSNGD